MNRKGMLLASETLKMVLAVICIGFLVYLLVSLYYSNIDTKKKEEAISTVGRISDVIDRINSGEISSESVTEIVPWGWTIFSFVEYDVKPNSCAGKNCFCICNDVFEYWGVLGERQLEECSDDGVCLIVENLMKFENIEISSDAGTSIDLFKEDSWIGVKEI